MSNAQRYNLFIAPFIAGFGVYEVGVSNDSAGWFFIILGALNWALGCWGQS